MSDGPRNEKARQRHRQLKKEVCGCVSPPVSAVASEASGINLTRQEFVEENHFGWTVSGRAHADKDFQRLKHRSSVVEETTVARKPFDSSRTSPGSPKPVHDRRETIDHTPVGPRNEVARIRHRQQRKNECGCSSVPVSAVPSEASSLHLPRRPDFNEENNFGWAVYGKAHGDPEFERMMQFHEKPKVSGNEFERKTYVLYLKEGTVVGQDLNMKQTQTSLPIGDLVTGPPKELSGDKEKRKNLTTEHPKKLSGDKEKRKSLTTEHPKELKGDKEKRKSLTTEYFFVPGKNRSQSRSPKLGKSKEALEGQPTDGPFVNKPESEEDNSKVHDANKEAGDVSATASREREIDQTKKKSVEKKTKKKGPIRWSLRAGGDSSKQSVHGSEKFKVLKTVSGFMRNRSKLIVGLKPSDASSSLRAPSSEYLLDTPSGTNQYLYVSSSNGNRKEKSTEDS